MKNIRELVLILLSAGILMLVMGSAGESAKRTRCMGSLKKLYGMTLSYENDHGGLPPVTIPAKPLWKFWSHCLRPYSTDKLDFCCPADKRNEYMFKPESPLFCPVVQSAASYGMNYFLTARSAGRAGAPEPRLRFLKNPAGVVLFGDSRGPYMLPPRFWQHEKDFRHENERANFVFADGHVEFLRQNDFGTTAPDGSFVTDFSKWHWN